MSTVVDNGNDALRFAEYVLGVLDADARAAVAAEVRSSAEAATSVAMWERHLMPLADEIANVAPPPYVWARIADALTFDAAPRATARDAKPPGFWNNLRLWHWIGIGASATCDGQVLVTDDMLGLFERTPRFVKRYDDLATRIGEAAQAYAEEVRGRRFPTADQTYRSKA